MNSETTISLREMFTELRRLEDCIRYFENAVLRQRIAIEELEKLLMIKEETQESKEPKQDGRFGRKVVTIEEIQEAIRLNGGYKGAAERLGLTVQNLRNRIYQAKLRGAYQTAA